MYYFAFVKATHNKGYLLKGKASSVDEFKNMISGEYLLEMDMVKEFAKSK